MSYFKNKNLLVTGGEGFVGTNLVKELIKRGVEKNNIQIPIEEKCDLRMWDNCKKVVKDMDIVIHLAARVGGIGYNQKHPSELFYDNVIMSTQLMEAARQVGVNKYVTVSTACAYPSLTPVPFREEDIWSGYPEKTNAPYGIAKKIQLVQSQSYRDQYGFNSICLVPVNMYGPWDNFDPKSSHVIPALILKIKEAQERGEKELQGWGTGEVFREFLYVEDSVEGILLATEHYNSSEPVNLGTGKDVKIKDLFNLISKLMAFDGTIKWDSSKPDGQINRRLNVEKAENMFNFKASTSLEEGLEKTIRWFYGAKS
jgi:GDP-L-fucose synthase